MEHYQSPIHHTTLYRQYPLHEQHINTRHHLHLTNAFQYLSTLTANIIKLVMREKVAIHQSFMIFKLKSTIIAIKINEDAMKQER